MAIEIHIGLFIWEVINEAVDIDGDINTVDISGRMREVVRLDGSKRYRRESFLFSKGAFWFH